MKELLINDLAQHVHEIQEEIREAINRVIGRGWFVMGPEVSRFEGMFADYLGVEHCCSVANGTDALEIAFRALGIQSGDVVATVANAGAYTTTALRSLGAVPVFMDVDLDTQLVLDSEVERVLGDGVKAVVLTHLYGRAIPSTPEIVRKCVAKGAVVIEDCAQAHGASLEGRQVGSFGDVGCFSFYPTKNLGALGDGGAITTRHASIAERLRRLRQYGWTDKYQIEFEGARNSRLDEMQAAVLSAVLPKLDEWNIRRREIAERYSTSIKHPDVSVPQNIGLGYVGHLYTVRSEQRASLQAHLRSQGIRAEVHYPIPDHRQPVFANMFTHVSLANTERLAKEILTLPCYPEMTSEDVERVISAVNSWVPSSKLPEGECPQMAVLAA